MGSPTTPGLTGFQFITSINTINRDEETRRRVRSHARRQKLPNESAKSSQSAPRSATQKERTSKFRVRGNDKASLHTKNNGPAKSSPARGGSSASSHDKAVDEIKVEPRDGWQSDMITRELSFTIAPELPTFAVLPIRTTPLTDNLFKYIICVCLSPQEKFVQRWFDRCGAPTYFNTYHSSFLSLSHAMNPQGNWFDFITVDPAMTHGFMGLVAAMHNALAEWDDTTTIDFHRYETVKYINMRLNLEGRDATNPVSDGVVVSVSLLVQVESFTGSLTSARAHMLGLKKMVDMRGGLLEGFGYSTLLQRALSWADFAYASAAQTPLLFPFIPELAASMGIQDRFLSRSMMINTNPSNRNLYNITIRDREAVELFEMLYSTTEAITKFEYAKVEDLYEQRSDMSDSIYLTEYRLCKLEEKARSRGRHVTRAASMSFASISPIIGDGNERAASGFRNLTDISDALVYASHLFLHMALRGQPPQAKRHKGLTEALMTSLYDTLMYLNILFDSAPISSVGSIVASSSPDPSTSEGSSIESWPGSTREFSETSVASDSPGTEMKDELHDEILLWILFIGACVQIRPSLIRDESLQFESLGDHRSFFLGALRKFCIARGFLGREILLTKLKAILWLDSWCDQQLDLVWARIGNELGV